MMAEDDKKPSSGRGRYSLAEQDTSEGNAFTRTVDSTIDSFGEVIGNVFGGNETEDSARVSAVARANKPVWESDPNDPYKKYTQFQEDKRREEELQGRENVAIRGLTDAAFAGMEAVDYVWSHGVSRPLSTTAILTSEMYDSDDEKKLNVRDAWNRSAEVSFGMASMDSQVEVLQTWAAAFGVTPPSAITDFDVDIWDNDAIEQHRQEITAYNYVTGSLDFALNLAPIPAGKGLGAASRAAGLSRRGGKKVHHDATYDAIKDGMLARGIDVDHEAAVTRGVKTKTPEPDEFSTPLPDDAVPEIGAPKGKEDSAMGTNAIADLLIDAKNAKSAREITQNSAIRNLQGADHARVADAILNAPDHKTVIRIWMAINYGDLKAADKLLGHHPAIAAKLSGVDDVIRKSPEGEVLPKNEKLDEAYLDSMTDEELSIYNALFIEGGFVKQSGSKGAFTPRMGIREVNNPIMKYPAMATRALARASEAATVQAGKLRAAADTGDFSGVGQRVGFVDRVAPDGTKYQEAVLGSRFGLMTRVFNFHPVRNQVGRAFSRVPLNVINFTRVRPEDVMDEFYAMVNDTPALRNPRAGNTGDLRNDPRVPLMDGTLVTPEEYVRMRGNELARASNRTVSELREKFMEIQIEMVYMVGRRRGLSDQKIGEMVAGFNERSSQFKKDLVDSGSYMDTESGMKIAFDPETLRMLSQGELLIPLREFNRYLKQYGGSNPVVAAQGFATRRGGDLFDVGSAFFRTGMLLKPGYIMRNALFEPGITALIAHADVAPGMLFKDTLVGLRRFLTYQPMRAANFAINRVSPAKKGKVRAALTRYQTTLTEKDRQIAWLKGILDEAPSGQTRALTAEQGIAHANGTLTNVLRTIADIDEGVAVELAAMRNFEEVDGIATGAADILNGSDAPLDSVAREIEILEELAEDAEFSVMLEYLDKVYIKQEVFLAVREARQSLRTRDQIKQKPDAKQMDAEDPLSLATGKERRKTDIDGVGVVSQDILKSVQELLKGFKSKQLAIRFSTNDEYLEIMESLDVKTRAVEDALVALRGEQSRVAQIMAKRDARRRKTRRGKGDEGTQKKTLGKGIYGVEQEIDYDTPLSGPIGDAHRAEASGRNTQLNTFAPTGGESINHILVRRRLEGSEIGPIGPNHPNYWEDLHWSASRHYAQQRHIEPAFRPRELGPDGRDVRIDEIVEEIMKDRNYRDQMNLKNAEQVRAHAVQVINNVDSMFPTQAAKDLIRSGENFGPSELQAAILSDPNVKLSPIDGEMRSLSNPSLVASVRNRAGQAWSSLWTSIAVTPEAKLGRWPFYARQHELSYMDNLNAMIAQSPTGKVTMAQQRAADKVAHREALREMEKTFYTIRRYNRSVFASRFLQSFPGAWANGLYRYLYYLPTRKPGPMASAMLLGKSALEEMIIGEDGERASYWDEDARLLMPTPPGIDIVAKWLGRDDGFEVSKDALTRVFADLPMSRSWLTAFTIDSFLSVGPSILRDRGLFTQADTIQGAQESIKETMDEAAPGVYDALLVPALFGEYGEVRPFLFEGDSYASRIAGILTGSVTPGHYRSAKAFITQAGDDYSRIANMFSQKLMAEKIANDDYNPVDFEKEVAQQARKWFGARLIEQVFNVALGAVPSPEYPGSLQRDAWYKVREENGELAYEEQLSLYLEQFPDADPASILPYTQSTSEDPYNIPATVAAFSEIEKFPKQAEAIAKLNPELVGLLVIDKDDTWTDASSRIYNSMKRDKPFPSAEDNYRQTMDPKEYTTSLEIDRGWDEFNATMEYLAVQEAIARSNGDKNEVKRIKAIRRDWKENTMQEKHPAWWANYYGGFPNRPKITAQAIETYILGDPKVRAEKMKSESWPAWELLEQFLADRAYIFDAKTDPNMSNEKRAELNDFMYNMYSDKMAEYPMTADLWNNVFEDEYFEEKIEVNEAGEVVNSGS